MQEPYNINYDEFNVSREPQVPIKQGPGDTYGLGIYEFTDYNLLCDNVYQIRVGRRMKFS